MEVKLMGGGKLSDDTTYKKYYRLKTDHFKAPQPIIHKEYHPPKSAIESF
jgi:hypothetical protein